jgi:hypothetical protein
VGDNDARPIDHDGAHVRRPIHAQQFQNLRRLKDGGDDGCRVAVIIENWGSDGEYWPVPRTGERRRHSR